MRFESIITKEGLMLLIAYSFTCFINISILLLEINQFACNVDMNKRIYSL